MHARSAVCYCACFHGRKYENSTQKYKVLYYIMYIKVKFAQMLKLLVLCVDSQAGEPLADSSREKSELLLSYMYFVNVCCTVGFSV